MRSALLSSLFIGLLCAAAAQENTPPPAASAEMLLPQPATPGAGYFNVMDFGVKGDGKTDDTAAFQSALNAAGAAGGGVLQVPAGTYAIRGHLEVPDKVTLQGVWTRPLWTQPIDLKGLSVLLAYEGKGQSEGSPFILLRNSSTLKGISVFYPEQVNSLEPHSYPWTVAGRGDNCTIVECTLFNPYRAVDFGSLGGGRHYINGLYGQPLFLGLYIDSCFDVGRVENVHFWPFWSGVDLKEPVCTFMREKGTAFLIGQTDGQMFSNCFCIYYRYGFKFIDTLGTKPDGSPRRGQGSGVYTNCYPDICKTSIYVEEVQPNSGISFINGMIMGGVEVAESNKGQVKFVACGFWANRDQETHARLQGRGAAIFEGCHFTNWDRVNQGLPCIDANNKSLIVTGCEFSADNPDTKLKVKLGANIESAIITSNRMVNGVEIQKDCPAEADVQIGFNTAK